MLKQGHYAGEVERQLLLSARCQKQARISSWTGAAMDVFVYASPGFGRPLDEVEEAIESFLEQSGEVTGSGAGAQGANIDIEIYDVVDPRTLLEGLRTFLASLSVPINTEIVLEGESFPVYEST